MNMPMININTAANEVPLPKTTQTPNKPVESFEKALSHANSNEHKAKQANGLTWRDVEKVRSQTTEDVSVEDILKLTNDATLNNLMEMLKKLLSGASKGLSEEDIANFIEVGEGIQKRLGELASEEGCEKAMQMMAQMFVQLPQDVTIDVLLQASPTEVLQAAGVLPQGKVVSDVKVESNMQDGIVFETVQNEAIYEIIKPVLPQQKAEVETVKNATVEEVAVKDAVVVVKDTEVVVKNATVDVKETAESGAELKAENVEVKHSSVKQNLDFEFQSSIRQVKEAFVKNDGVKTESNKPLDVDVLQKQVDSGMYLKNTAFSTAMDIESTKLPLPVQTQVYDGLIAAMEKGAKEYSIKLMPEGLGELTLRLTKAANGSMSLSMIAKNEQTQKMLAGEIAQLRETLKPLQVDVDNVLTKQQDMLMNQQKQFSEHKEQNPKTFKGAAYYGDEPLGTNEEKQNEQAYSINSVLNAYV